MMGNVRTVAGTIRNDMTVNKGTQKNYNSKRHKS